MKNIVTESKNLIDGLTAEWRAQIKELANWKTEQSIEITQSEQQRKKQTEKSKPSLRDLWDYNKRSTIHVNRVLERKE